MPQTSSAKRNPTNDEDEEDDEIEEDEELADDEKIQYAIAVKKFRRMH